MAAWVTARRAYHPVVARSVIRGDDVAARRAGRYRGCVVRAVFWDLDDTVLDTLPGRVDALAGAYEECLGTRPDALALWREHSGRTLEDLGRELLGDDAPLFVERYRSRYYALDVALRPFPGVVETLDALRAEGLQLAVVTSKATWGATGELTRARLLDRFATVVGWHDSVRHKPEPEPLIVAMERLRIDDPGTVAYVGDAPSDVRAARAAGCRAIGATWGSLDARRMRAERPDLLAHRPADVIAYVRRARAGASGD